MRRDLSEVEIETVIEYVEEVPCPSRNLQLEKDINP